MIITLQQLVFYFFSTLAVASSAMVVISKNPVRAVLFLVFAFFNMAAIWMLLESEFLAIVLVLVYVGAVMVLFLFVVMMLNTETSRQAPFVRHWPIGILVACALLTMMILMVGKQHFGLDIVFSPAPLGQNYSYVKVLGELLYTDFMLPFEIAGVILLVAMVAAISLTYRGPRNAKTQKISQQTQVCKSDRLTLVKMPSEKKEPA